MKWPILHFVFDRRRLIVTALSVLALTMLLRFATQPLYAQSNIITFGAGRGIHLVDPDGHNVLPISVSADSTVNATLFPLNPAAFVQRYLAYEPYSPQPIDTTELSATVTWAVSLNGTSYGELSSLPLPPTPSFSQSVSSGIYVIRAADEHGSSATAYTVVSRNVLVVKRGTGGQILVWASSLQERTPVAAMTVTLYDNTGNAFATGTTDTDGLVTFDVGTAMPLMAVGRTASDTTIAGLDWQWRLQNGRWTWSDPAQERYRFYLYTDRPLYRPGQVVHYHAVIRQHAVTGYTPLANTEPVTVALRDGRNNLMDTMTVTADEFGTINGTFQLSDEPPLGRYTVAVTIDGQTETQPLYIEEYRKPEYAVDVSMPSAYALSGATVPVTIDAAYYFGQPVADASIELKIYRQRLYRYTSWWNRRMYESYGSRTLVDTRTGETDSTGQWQTDLATAAWAVDDYDFHYTVEATVTDAREVPVSGRGTFNLYWNSFTVQVGTEKYGYGVGEPVAVTVSAQNHDKTARPNQPVTVRVIRPGCCGSPDTDVVAPQQLTTDGTGTVTVTYTTLAIGWYQLLVTALDDRGQFVTTTRSLWIYGEDRFGWSTGESDELTIVADRDSYAPGDTAQLLIQSKTTGMALLTLERAGVHTERIVQLDGPLTTVAIPISSDFAPNIFAHIHLFQPSQADNSDGANHLREGRLLSAQVALQVPIPEKRLTVAVRDLAADYAPGTEVPLTIQVTDHAGAPVRAQVAIALVDEALYALKADLAADLFDTFYGPSENTVATFESLVHQPQWNSWDRSAPIDEVGDEDETNDTSGDLQTRRNFQDTAYWNPTLVTDATGRVTTRVRLPDNLTTWRIIVRAVDAESAVGETRDQLLVTQELIARPALPRFAVVGDRFQAGLVAQNFTSGATNATGHMTSPALTLLGEPSHSFTLPQNGTATAHWTAVASFAGNGVVTTTLATPVGGDQVALSLPIKPFAVPERWSAAGLAAPLATETFTMPLNTVHEATALTVRLSPSLALGVVDGLDTLIDYPYGCVEQTMSRVLPTAVAAQAFATLGVENPRAAELPTIVNQGLQKLYGFQHSDGSWGWFYDDDGGLYLTSYVLFGLTATEQAGFTVDPAVIERGFTYIDDHLGQATDVGTKAYALYVKAVAGRGDLAAAQALLGQLAEMDTAMQAALALALQRGGDLAGAGQVAQHILATVTESPTTAFWALPQDEWAWSHWRTMASTEKNTALALRALTAIAPESPLLPKVVRWLMQQRRGAAWSNTQATAFAVLGLADYAVTQGELQAAYNYTVTLNGVAVQQGAVVPGTMKPLPPLVLTGDALRTGDNTLVISRSAAAAPLYYTALLERQRYYDAFAPTASADQGLALTRTYRLLEGTPRSDGAYDLGDLVEVTLQVTSQSRMSYLLVEDPIPAGFEVVNERLNAVSYGADSYSSEWRFFWMDWGYNRKNIRDDRVEFFVTDLWPGTHTLTYQMRATTAGTFGVLSAQAYPMYNDAIWGRSATTQLQVQPERLAQPPQLAGDFDQNCQITDLDVQLAAAAWGTATAQRNIVADTNVDLQDLAAVAARRGASCRADRVQPTASPVKLSLLGETISQSAWIGEPVRVTIRRGDIEGSGGVAPTLNGYGVTLNYDPTRLGFADIIIHGQTASTLPLGPVVDATAGTVRFGAHELATAHGFDTLIDPNQPLATVTFTGQAVGDTTVTLVAATAVDREGRQLSTTVANRAGIVSIHGKQIFLPIMAR